MKFRELQASQGDADAKEDPMAQSGLQKKNGLGPRFKRRFKQLMTEWKKNTAKKAILI